SAARVVSTRTRPVLASRIATTIGARKPSPPAITAPPRAAPSALATLNAAWLREAPSTSERCATDRKSTRLNSSHVSSSYAVFPARPPPQALSPYTPLFRSQRRQGGEHQDEAGARQQDRHDHRGPEAEPARDHRAAEGGAERVGDVERGVVEGGAEHLGAVRD